jgi:acyl-CoA synthetase (NDP forming)
VVTGLHEDTEGERRLEAALSERFATTRPALDAFLHPSAIAVVGASSDPDTISGLLFANLLNSPFGGSVLPVNKKHPVVQGATSYPDLGSCPVVPDLVIVCVPARAAIAVVAEAGELGVKAVCVISAGFAETGKDGVDLQAALAKEAAARGVRLVGPNCTGILSGSGAARFNATFSRTVPQPGRLALLSQSGAIGLAVLEAAQTRGLGIGGFVSVGNSVDIAGNDLLLHWGEDTATDLVLLYLESFQDPQSFVQIARSLSGRTPLIALKAGRTEAGRRGAASHTAALAAGDVAVDALFRQAGVIRAQSIEELLDLATVLSSQRRFRGSRVAILTNGGGPGVLAADACEANGLVVPVLSEATEARLRSLLPLEASVSNPVDMIASATARQYGEAARILGKAPEVDCLIVIFNTPLLTHAGDVARELVAVRASLERDVALVTVFMNKEGPPESLRGAAIPSFAYPENAVRSLARSIAWSKRRGRPLGTVLRPEVDDEAVGRLVASARPGTRDGWIEPSATQALLEAYGIALPRAIRVRTPSEAATAQAELGCIVVVKLDSPIHKSELGGVRLGLSTPAEAAEAVRAIRLESGLSPTATAASEFLVQEQVGSGLEMIVGLKRDPALGPLVLVGLGGTLVEVLDDVAIGMAPLTDEDIDEMLRSLKCYRLLTGHRGTPPLDIGSLSGVLHRVSALADDLPELDEMDINPLFVLEQGAIAADIRIRIKGR